MVSKTAIAKVNDIERRKKALLYTLLICGSLLIMFFLISWKNMPPAPPLPEQLIEVNLGNNDEGFGTVQPLIKGERGPSKENIVQPTPAYSKAEEAEKVTPDDNAEENAAPVNKPVKDPAKLKTEKVPSPVVPVAKPQKPKITYDGPGKGTGNNTTEDNGYKYQGNKPGGKGDAGDPDGNKDSYGNNPGGKIGGGPRVTKGNRRIVNYPSFNDNLDKATIYAIIKVLPSGKGTFIAFDKGSTSRSPAYATAIGTYLNKILFDKTADESTVTVQFNFTVN